MAGIQGFLYLFTGDKDYFASQAPLEESFNRPITLDWSVRLILNGADSGKP
jgi:hypothetical protein